MHTRSSKPAFYRLQAVAAILLMEVNLAFAATPPQTQSAPVNAPAAQPAPEAPAPVTSGAAAPPNTLAQQMQQAQHGAILPPRSFHVDLPHSHKPFSQYMPSDAPPLDLANSPRLENLVRDGKLYISLHDAIALAIENNLDLAFFRYNFPIAQTDFARTKAGSPAQGVNTGIVQSSTEGGFSGGNSSSGGSGSNGANSGSAAGAGGLVQSTLGAGATVASFDPFLKFQGFDDHTITQEGNSFSNGGVSTFKVNTIEGLAGFSQAFPLGTSVNMYYEGQRYANNSLYEAINPTLYSNFQFQITQQLLAGFGIASNERYIHIAKKNIQITDLAFRAQVIATITQVEDIYWDLVNAYQDEQVKERSLAFERRTLQDDQKQLDLHAIPALQVSTDESVVATSEGDLTVSRATLRLNELLIKNALTKTDSPEIDEMPVIPLDRVGLPDPNASKSIDDLIAEAEKNRPDVAMDNLAMQVAEISLKGIRSELLPNLNVYGLYAGAGTAGPKDPYCALTSTECTSNLPTGFGSMFANTFNYSSPEYQFGMNLSINLRNRQAKADQFRAVLEFRQKQINFEEQKKTIRFDVRNSLFALQQAQARVDAAAKARDLAQHTFEVTQQEQQLGAKASSDTLAAQDALSIAESLLVVAQTALEKAKVDIDRATGETLEQTGTSIDDAKTGVVSHEP
jgi:outer membrane protein TolC